MLAEVVVGGEYRSASGYRFKVITLARHAQDCSIGMVVYEALEPTFDAPAGSVWTLEERLFLKRFSELEDKK